MPESLVVISFATLIAISLIFILSLKKFEVKTLPTVRLIDNVINFRYIALLKMKGNMKDRKKFLGKVYIGENNNPKIR